MSVGLLRDSAFRNEAPASVPSVSTVLMASTVIKTPDGVVELAEKQASEKKHAAL